MKTNLLLLVLFGLVTQVHAEPRARRGADAVLPLPEPSEANSYVLADACEGKTYYSFMEAKMTPHLQELAETPTRMSNDDALSNGQGIGVKLDEENYNFHINYPNSDKGGRSYGWSHGTVGDWSDKKFLDSLAEVVKSSDEELHTFYSSIIQMLGNCNASDLANLERPSQQVSNNFLAIYTAEQYRAMVGNSRWDDALFEVTLLGAFHGGQRKLTKYYDGEFLSEAVDQSGCAYHGRDKADAEWRAARLNDYWQFGRSVFMENGRCRGTSGINPTRKDFEAMGKAITTYEKTVARNKTLARIQAVVGTTPNVIKAISEHFTKNNAEASQTDALADDVAKFMVDINNDANKITKWLESQE